MPVRTALYSTGRTIRKLMRMESDRPLTHTSARMMKLATGVALTSWMTGASSVSTQAQRSAAAASENADHTPSANPSTDYARR